jgi:hypothetical protein
MGSSRKPLEKSRHYFEKHFTFLVKKLHFMNKFKLFLGVSCLVLAVGSAFATNAASENLTYYYYQNELAGTEYGPCLTIVDPVCSDGPIDCEKSIPTIGFRYIYEFDNCTQVLKHDE